MTSIAVTRFDKYTWEENLNWRKAHNWDGCVYQCTRLIKDGIPLRTGLYVLEMNNTTNKIMGIGYIKNYPNLENNPRIYSNQCYNFYLYKGKYHINVDEITDEDEKKIINIINKLIFTGKGHFKRGLGIQELPMTIKEVYVKEIKTYIENNKEVSENIYDTRIQDISDLLIFFKHIFCRKYDNLDIF
tara:strand:+ start:1056 stop:1616 length:561 start_codon:yes stop_codon:yes gene_type:complete